MMIKSEQNRDCTEGIFYMKSIEKNVMLNVTERQKANGWEEI